MYCHHRRLHCDACSENSIAVGVVLACGALLTKLGHTIAADGLVRVHAAMPSPISIILDAGKIKKEKMELAMGLEPATY